MDRSAEWLVSTPLFVAATVVSLWMAGAIDYDTCDAGSCGRLATAAWAFGVADEPAAILRRTKYGLGQEAHLYHMVTNPDELQATFLDYVDVINSLYRTPR
jgi:hypothetical protein